MSEKRYRYTGKERDEETGFQYHSARYLAPWLGRWTSADPAGLVDDTSRFSYAAGMPVVLTDPNGRQSLGPTRDRANQEAAAKQRRAPGEAERLKWEDALKRHDLKAIAELRQSPTCSTAKLPSGADTPKPPPVSPKVATVDIARPQKRVMTAEDYNKILQKSREQPFYGLGVSGAAALGQEDPDKIDQAGDFATAVGAVGSMARLTQLEMKARAERSAYKDGEAAPSPELKATTVTPEGKSRVSPSERPIVTLDSGSSKIVISELPGERGIIVPRRLTVDEMAALQREFGREFALVYRTGAGRNGGGGTYWLYSGATNSVKTDVGSNIRLIYHTHPKEGEYGPSPEDVDFINHLRNKGSPQNVSRVIEHDGSVIRFGTPRIKKPK